MHGMSDRISIGTGQTDQRRLSDQKLLTCYGSCGFGYAEDILHMHGIILKVLNCN